MLEKKILEILCCPKDKGDLEYFPEENILKCTVCNHIFEIKDDIPIMIFEEKK